MPPKYERPPRGSIVDEAEPRFREMLQLYPSMLATVIAERTASEFHTGVPAARPAHRVCRRDIAQCDLWIPDVEIAVGFGQIRTRWLLAI